MDQDILSQQEWSEAMTKIDLNGVQQVRIAGKTSKGNQAKWNVRKEWIKADQLGYEALAEVVVSALLRYSNVEDFVIYKPAILQYDGKERVGCVSNSFQKPDDMLIPFERLHRMYTGRGLAETLGKMADAKERIKYTVDFVEEKTGLKNIGEYLTTLLELDSFTLNEDRHTNNLAVIRNERTAEFRLCPIFDNGLSLLSDSIDYQVDKNIYLCIYDVKAKPFDLDFNAQVEAAWSLYGAQLEFSFDRYKIPEILSEVKEYYDDNIINRVERILLEQMRKYQIYFK